jgi:acyl carrier protein
LDFREFKKFTAAEFEVDDEGLTSESKIYDLPQWNSLNALIYISSIKETFGVVIRSTDLASKRTLGELFELLEDRKSNGT